MQDGYSQVFSDFPEPTPEPMPEPAKKITEITEVTGTLQRIIFNKESFIIALFNATEMLKTLDEVVKNGLQVCFVMKGQMANPQIGLQYKLSGKFVNSPKWGNQFQFDSYESIYPVESESIKAYLRENIKWIGPITADRLIETFGPDTLEICKSNPIFVAQKIRGITPARAEEISRMLCANSEFERCEIELKRLFMGITLPKRLIPELIAIYQQRAADVVKENPYQLTQFSGVSFLRADAIAERCEIPRDSIFRIDAGILFVLELAEKLKGHTCLPIEQLELDSQELLALDHELVSNQIFELIKNNTLHADPGEFDNPSIMISRQEVFEKEVASAGMVQGILSRPIGKLEESIYLADDLAPDQRLAVEMCLANRFFCLTGAPGTGKTYAVNRILRAIPDGFSAALCAPTGKAAIRLAEMTGIDASTIHKLLGKKTFSSKEYGPDFHLPYSVVVVDEVSMMDYDLFHWLITACKPTTHIIFVGDTNQLPSVGAGAVLRDLLAAGVPHVELTEIKRQDAGNIVKNCHRVKNGLPIIVDNSISSDFFFISEDEPERIREKIVRFIKSGRLQNHYDVDIFRDVQVLAPMREKGPLSCAVFNNAIRLAINGHNNPNDESARFWPGDKVLQTKNDYDLGIINGDIGYIAAIRENVLEVDFEAPTRRVPIPLYENDLVLAYACTIHKYQGSEVPVVIMPVHKCFGPVMFQRNLLYTAISRAKTACILVGQIGEANKAISRVSANARYTRLHDLLGDLGKYCSVPAESTDIAPKTRTVRTEDKDGKSKN